jgi:hypothetical protein
MKGPIRFLFTLNRKSNNDVPALQQNFYELKNLFKESE